MTFWVVGAGAVGLTVAARLARAEQPVRVVSRRPDVVRRITREGIGFEEAATGQAFRVPVEARSEIDAQGESDTLLLCVRSTDTESMARTLAEAAPGSSVASIQNDIDNERILARHFERVVGVAYWQTCTLKDPNSVTALGNGRIVLGVHRGAAEAATHEIANAFARADYGVEVSPSIEADKWLKLCINLMSAPNALVRRDDHSTDAFVESKARLLEEARAALAAAGIATRAASGARSLDEEIVFQREALARGTSARRLPLYNQAWAALKRGTGLEADRYHKRIIELATRFGTPAPINRRVLELLERAHAEGSGPECVEASELLNPP